MTTPVHRRALILAFAIVYVVWGSTYLAIRYAIESLPPFLMAGTRFLLAGALLSGWAALRGAPRPTRREWGAAALLGILYIVLGNGLVVWAESRIDSGAAALLVAGTPFWVALFERQRRGIPLGGRKLLGLAVGTVGLVLLIGPGAARGLDLLGAALVLSASVSWSFASVLQKEVGLPKDRTAGAGAQMLAGGGVMLVLGTLGGEWGTVASREITLRAILAWAYLVVFGSMIAFSAFTWLIAHVEASRVATYAYVNPVVAVLLGWALGGEQVGTRMLGAMVLILGAVAVILWPAAAPTPPGARPAVPSPVCQDGGGAAAEGTTRDAA